MSKSNKLQASELERINQIEEKLSPQIINEIRAEHLEKRNNDQNITYQKENRTVKSSTEVDLNSLPFAEIQGEDRVFIDKLADVGKELGILINLLETAKLKAPDYNDIKPKLVEYLNNVKQLTTTYNKKTAFIQLGKDFIVKGERYLQAVKYIQGLINNLDKANCCSKGSSKKVVYNECRLLSAHDNFILTLTALKPKKIQFNSGEVIIEKIVEAEPNAEKIRELVRKYIQAFLPQQKPPEVIIQKETKTVVVPAEPDNLGKAYQLLYGQKDYAEALKLLKELSSEDNHDAQAALGTMYMEGLGVMKDNEKAAEWFKKAIQGENAEALHKLGSMLEKGEYKEFPEHEKNIELALDYYKRSATKNNLSALTDLAYMFENGTYVKKDIPQAERLLKIAGETFFFPRALNNLGSLYYNELIKVRPSNDEKAFEKFKQAAFLGYPKAITNLGICHEKGKAVPRSRGKAIDLYQNAAQLGDVDGMYHLAYHTLEDATRSNEEDLYADAADLFRQVIMKDPHHAEAYYYMGFLYENGLGVDKDAKSSFRSYRKAADLKHPKAWTKLGNFYSKGFGVHRDFKNALESYEIAAHDLNDAEAYNLLGIIYEEGIEVPPDYELAYEYYSKAAELNNPKAKLNLGLMQERGRTSHHDPIDGAVTSYVEAADAGNVTAHMMLSTRDFNTAYKNSIRFGREDASTIDGPEMDNILRPGSPNDQISININTNAVSQYVKAGDLRLQGQKKYAAAY